jgi:hypothetical protein
MITPNQARRDACHLQHVFTIHHWGHIAMTTAKNHGTASPEVSCQPSATSTDLSDFRCLLCGLIPDG